MEFFLPDVELETNEEIHIEAEAQPSQIIDVQTYVCFYFFFTNKLANLLNTLYANKAMHRVG